MAITRENAENALRTRWLLRMAVELVFVRTAAGLTQAELADKIGVPVRTIRRAERGSGDFRISILPRIAVACGFMPFEVQVMELDGALKRMGLREPLSSPETSPQQ